MLSSCGGLLRRVGLGTLRAAASSSAHHPSALDVPEGPSDTEFNGFIPMSALKVAYARSSAPGGQHVNKTESRAEIRFSVADAEWIQPPELRDAFAARYAHRLNSKGEIIIRSERTRSQQLNLADCLDKLRFSIREVAQEMADAAREPSENAVEKWRRLEAKSARDRLRSKQHRSLKKAARNNET